MADAELSEMWKLGLGVAQSMCIPLFVTSIGMYSYLGTRSTRYYQGLVRTFRGFFLPNWVFPLVYMAWMAASGFAFWLVTYATDCDTEEYGFDRIPWTLFFYLLWTIPMGVRLFFYLGRQHRSSMFAADLTALGLAIVHFVMALVYMPSQDALACELLTPPVEPLSSLSKIFFYVFWGLTIAVLFVLSLRDFVIMMKKAQSFYPIVDWMKLWYESEAECVEPCLVMTECELRAMEKKYPGFTEAYDLVRDAQRQERIAKNEAKAARRARRGGRPAAAAADEEAGFADAGPGAGETGDATDVLEFDDEDTTNAAISGHPWAQKAAAYRKLRMQGGARK